MKKFPEYIRLDEDDKRRIKEHERFKKKMLKNKFKHPYDPSKIEHPNKPIKPNNE